MILEGDTELVIDTLNKGGQRNFHAQVLIISFRTLISLSLYLLISTLENVIKCLIDLLDGICLLACDDVWCGSGPVWIYDFFYRFL